jgi:hypothetical protein
MESKSKNEKTGKEFLKTKIKLTVPPPSTPHLHVSSGTMEEHNFIGHSRNSRKLHYFQASRD